MTNKQEVEKFLINKYGVGVFKYKGFKYLRDIIADNDDYITGSIIQEYVIVAAEYNESYPSVERAIRYFQEMLDPKHRQPNAVFINNLIFEFKKHKENEV